MISSLSKIQRSRCFHANILRTLSTRLTPADVQLRRLRESSTYSSRIEQDGNFWNELVYCLSMAPENTDFNKNFHKLFPQSNNTMKEQLAHTVQTYVDEKPLPTNLQDALRPTRRALVITETKAPFVIFNVNKAWEELCGYKYIECRGKTLGSMLKGPETDPAAATGLIHQLLQGNEAGTTITNYTKEGRRFRNRIRVGPLKNTNGEITHFVGVLQEIKDGI